MTPTGTLLVSIKQAIKERYAWPGGYPLFLVMSDGGALCMDCVTKEAHNIFDSTAKQIQDGWQAAGIEVNWDDCDLTCCHCNKPIKSAYGED